MNRLARLTLTATLGLTLAACTTSPTGRSQLALFSQDEVNQMGDESFAQYQQQLPVVQGQTAGYVTCVAHAVTAQVPAEASTRQWEVKVFKDDEANAFALPGGHIGVNTGLLNVAKNQDQLAAVLGHEVSHVLAHHANERVSTQSVTQTGLSVLQSAAGLESASGQQLLGLLGAGAQYGVILPFSRRQESEADLMGLDLMAKAGFDPQASIALWQNMSASSQGEPPVWASTHPSNGQRTDALQSHMTQARQLYQQAQQAGRKPDCNRLQPSN